MVKFMTKYGGGITQKATFELIEYLGVRMPDQRRVPGYMFNHVASIPLSQEFQVPRLAVC